MLENMHDVPYMHTSQVGPEITAAMSVICAEVRRVFYPGPVGVQVLAGANKQALAIAKAAGRSTFQRIVKDYFCRNIYSVGNL